MTHQTDETSGIATGGFEKPGYPTATHPQDNGHAVDRVLDRLNRDKIKKQSGQWVAQCPAHEDRTPSLTVKDAGDRVLVHCHAGCTVEDIVTAVGLTVRDLFTDDDRSAEMVVAEYTYTDEDGRPLFVVRRRVGKKFTQHRPDGRAGIKGVRRVLYRLPEVAASVAAGRAVYVVEGEKDADRLSREGVTATTSPMGAEKWNDDYTPTLASAHVVIVPDNDEPGLAHADQIARSVAPVAASVRVLHLPDLPRKGDVSDWLNTGHTVAELADLARATPEWTPHRGPGDTLADLLDREIPPTRYAIDGLFPEGLIVLGGKPKVGKSWLVALMTLAVASGSRLLDDYGCEAGEVLHIAYEDGDSRLQSRYKVVGALGLTRDALQRIHLRTDWPTLDGGGIDALDRWLTDHPKARLVVLDTFQRFRGSSNLSAKDRYAHDYEQAAQLQKLAVRHRIALVVVHHLRQQGAEDWLDQISGTSGITGAADTLVALFRERGEHDATLRYLGRDIDEGEVALRFNAGVWENLGDPDKYRTTKERREVLDALDALGPTMVTDLALHLGKKTAAVSYLLRQLEKEGKVHTPKYGQYDLAPTGTHEPLELLNSLQGNQGNQGGERKGQK